MNRSDDYGRRRWPDQRYGGYEEGYGHVPGDDHHWRRRDLSAGRYGNTRERNPYDTDTWRNVEDRDNGAWRRGRTAQLSDGWRSRHATVYYPGRSVQDEARDESSPHERGYVSAYSTGYEDGYTAGARASRDEVPGPPERWQGTGGSYESGYEGDAVRTDRQRSRGEPVYGQERVSAYGYERDTRGEQYARPTGPKNYTRSDERIREEVCERLAHAPELDVSEVTVTVIAGVVTLTGSVVNRRVKYRVEDIADDTYGVSDVVNQIHVQPYGVLASE